MTSAMDVVECTTNIQAPFENDISPTRPKEPIEYMTIREVLEKFNRREPLPKVNIFGVVTYLPSEVKAIEKKGSSFDNIQYINNNRSKNLVFY